MTDHKKPSGIYFGWWTVLVTGTVSGLGVGIYVYGISALFKPISSDLGLSRALTSGAPGIGIVVGCVLAPFVGMVVDKFGPRLPNFFGLLTLITGLVLMNFVTSLWGLYLAWGVITGIGVHLGLTLAMDKAVTNWFFKRIGLAMGVRFALIGVFSALSLPLISWLVSRLGWRTTCLIWAAILLPGLPSVLLFVRNKRPEHYGLLPDGDKVGPDSERILASLNAGIICQTSPSTLFEFNLLQTMKTKAFWILAASFLTQLFVMVGFNTHCIPLLTGMDIDPVVAGGMMGIMLVFTIPSRLMSGILADRISKNRLNLLLILPFLLIIIGVGVFLTSQTIFTVYILLILYGLSHGLPAPLFIVIVSRYFGRKAFGSIMGITFLLASPAALLSPTLTGWLFDRTGSYNIALMSFAFISLLAIFLLLFLKEPNLPPLESTSTASAGGK
ncbi:MAG: MFS transporter [Desulfobacterales bacterium]|nr:MFS transporter [Desulfobacterales bacterium]